MKVLVTGANSLLGANMIAELLKRGYTIRGMVRRHHSIPIKDERIEEYIGKITLKTDVYNAVKGCDTIIHIAANTTQDSLCYDDYASVNVEGTKYILEAAKIFQIKRTILVSSANTIGFGTKENPGTEEKKFCYPFTKSCYARSKQEAQTLALEYPQTNMGDIIIVNPAFMIGQYDTKPSSGKIILRGYKKRIVFIPPGGKNFIHVKDVANAICDTIQLGRNRQCYLLCNENMSYKSFYERLNAVTDNTSLIVTLPCWLLLSAGFVGSFFAKFGIKTALHYNNMRILCVKNYYSNQKAREEFKLRTTPVTEAIKDAVTWFTESGMLKK